MFDVVQGGKQSEEYLQKEVLNSLLVALGMTKKVIALNGGSDTRKSTREYYHEMYKGSNTFKVTSNAFSVTIQGHHHGHDI